MGDAVGEEVVKDPVADVDTIDGLIVPRAAPPGAPDVGPDRDYPELVAVDRHHYVATREIAKGGMGRVFEARDRRLGRQVAIKELLPRNRDAARRFEREARITARLQHPAIIHIYEAGTWPGGEPFFAMTHVSGRSLDKVVAERRSLAARIGLLPNVIDIADALAYAHSERVIHRDLKPANVLVGDYGETVVIDWGLAKDLSSHDDDAKESMRLPLRVAREETMSGSVVGTPAYMPPEQARGEPVDERADVYALGALLYHVLVGAAPYAGSADDVLEQVKSAAPVSVRAREPGAPADLVAIVAKAMARDPAERYANAREVALDLKRFETGQLVAAHNYTTRQLALRWLRRYRIVVAITSAAVIALAVSARRLVTERDRAQVGRVALLDEQGRNEMLAAHAGPALAYLVGAARDGEVDAGRNFVIAEAKRLYETDVAHLDAGSRSVEIAVSPDGASIATATRGVVKWWRIDGTLRAALPMPAVDVQTLAFDPASTRLAAAGSDGTLRIWDLADRSLHELSGHSGPILDLAWSPDGTRLATAGDDRTARVWNATTGAVTTSLCEATGRIGSVRFSPNGSQVASASADGTACVWNLADDRVHPLRGHRSAVNTVRWSHDGAYVVTASDDGTAMVWNPETGKPVIAPLRAGQLIKIAEISPDGRRIFTGGSDGVGRVWELPDEMAPTMNAERVAQMAGAEAMTDAAFSADGKWLATAGFDRLAKVWDAESGQPIAAFEHSDVVTSVAFVGAKQLVTCGRNGLAQIWDLEQRVEKQQYDVDSPVHAVAVSPSGAVAAGSDNSRVTLWRDHTKTVLKRHLGRVFALAFSDDGTQLVTAGEDARAIVWDGSGNELGTLGDHTSPVRAVAFSHDGKLVATASRGLVQLWTPPRPGSEPQQPVRKLVTDVAEISSVAFGAGGIVAAGVDSTVWLWGPSGPAEKLSATRPVYALAFRHDGARLVVAGESYAEIYRVDGGHIVEPAIATLEGFIGKIAAVSFTPDGSLVVTAGADGVARVWDAAKGKLLGQRVAHGVLGGLAVTADGNRLWLASEDNTVTEWDIHASTDSVAELDRFVAKRVAWQLDDDDVVRFIGERGENHGQR